jgi:serine/threonine protein kinase
LLRSARPQHSFDCSSTRSTAVLYSITTIHSTKRSHGPAHTRRRTETPTDMAESGDKPTLFRRLRKAQAECPNEGQQRFLPIDSLNAMITEEAIKQAMPSKQRLLSRTLPSKIALDARKTFAILVEIGEVPKMKELFNEGLTDAHLPLVPTNQNSNELQSERTGKRFPSFAHWTTEQRVTDFVDKQWNFLAPVLDTSGAHVELSSKCPLPFLEMDEIGHTGTSTVYKSTLHHAHFVLSPLSSPHALPSVSPPTPSSPYPHFTIAAKEHRTLDLFTQEKKNLDTALTLSHPHHKVPFGTLRKGALHYILFPWASGGNLRDFWRTHNHLARDADLALWTLRQSRGVADALAELHRVNCRHGDLKPENILHFTTTTTTSPDRVNGTLLIADVGISRTHTHATSVRQVGTTTRATTPAYEAPEARAHDAPHAPRARRYDVWSLGCIFLEFAVWLLCGEEALGEFEAAREDTGLFYVVVDGGSGDGEVKAETKQAEKTMKIHPVVISTLADLRRDPRCAGDTAFGSFIDVMERDLLRIDVEQRVSAAELAEKLKQILQRAEGEETRVLFNDISLTGGSGTLQFGSGVRGSRDGKG